MNDQNNKDLNKVTTMAEWAAKGETPELLLWVGCAGSYDQRYKKVTKALIKILNAAGVQFGVLGPEESCSGDPARRAGNEFLFQMQAASNIQVMNGYKVKKILTACPHCYNTFKNEYPDLGGHYEVVHHSVFIERLISEGRVKTDAEVFKGTDITYHDSCYLGRANHVYEAPRQVVRAAGGRLVEMKRHHSNGFCCGAGGAQIFKEAEKGTAEVYDERTHEAVQTGATVIATACPFCMTMFNDGIKNEEKENEIKVLDIAELIARSNGLI
jgi:Fe-S oxidoreductase